MILKFRCNANKMLEYFPCSNTRNMFAETMSEYRREELSKKILENIDRNVTNVREYTMYP